jgi:choline dehydrogenase
MAYGVEYIRHGEKKTAFATKEVILSAGVINSPKLLMHSGIGPKAQLEPLGVC